MKTYKDFLIDVLKSAKEPHTCAELKRKINTKFKVKIKDGTISSLLFKFYQNGIVIRHGNIGPRSGCGYMLSLKARLALLAKETGLCEK